MMAVTVLPSTRRALSAQSTSTTTSLHSPEPGVLRTSYHRLVYSCDHVLAVVSECCAVPVRGDGREHPAGPQGSLSVRQQVLREEGSDGGRTVPSRERHQQHCLESHLQRRPRPRQRPGQGLQPPRRRAQVLLPPAVPDLPHPRTARPTGAPAQRSPQTLLPPDGRGARRQRPVGERVLLGPAVLRLPAGTLLFGQGLLSSHSGRSFKDLRLIQWDRREFTLQYTLYKVNNVWART